MVPAAEKGAEKAFPETGHALCCRRFDGAFFHHTRVSSAAHIGDGRNFMVEDHVYIGPFNFIDTFRKVTIGEGFQVRVL